MKKISTILLVLAAVTAFLSTSAGADTAVTDDDGERLSVSFLSSGFLAEVTAEILERRTDSQRLAGGYLQEESDLVWARADNGKDLDWYAADEYCDSLEVADWSDWRMPSIDELEALHEPRSNSTYKLPRDITLTGCCPWSDSRSSESSAWNFSFRYRKRFSGSLNLSFELRALCVRAATEADLLFFEAAAEAEKEKEKRKRKS